MKKKKKLIIPPSLTYYADVTSGDRPLQVQFDASGSTDEDGDVLSYSWDFGDGNTSTNVSVSKTILVQPVLIMSTLKVTDEEGLIRRCYNYDHCE